MSISPFLDYARKQDIALDHLTEDYLTQVATILTNGNERGSNTSLDAESTIYIGKHKDEICYEDYLPSKGSIYLLESITRRPKINMDYIYRDILPKHRHVLELKVEIPMLQRKRGNVKRDVGAVRSGLDLERIFEEARLNLTKASMNTAHEEHYWRFDYAYLSSSNLLSEPTMVQEKLQVPVSILEALQTIISMSTNAVHPKVVYEQHLPLPRSFCSNDIIIPMNANIFEHSTLVEGDGPDSNSYPGSIGKHERPEVHTNISYDLPTQLVREIDHELVSKDYMKSKSNHDMPEPPIISACVHVDQDRFREEDSADVLDTTSSVGVHAIEYSKDVPQLRSNDSSKLSQDIGLREQHIHFSTRSSTDFACSKLQGLRKYAMGCKLVAVDVLKVNVPKVNTGQPELKQTHDIWQSIVEQKLSKFAHVSHSQEIFNKHLSNTVNTTDILEEAIDGPPTERIISQPSNIIASAQILWKESGLRLLDNNDYMQHDNQLWELDGDSEDSDTASVEGSDFLAFNTTSNMAMKLFDVQVAPSTQSKAETITPNVPSNAESNDETRTHQTGKVETTVTPPLHLQGQLHPLAGKQERAQRRHPSAKIPSTFKMTCMHSLNGFLDLRGIKYTKPPHTTNTQLFEMSQDPIESTQVEEVEGFVQTELSTLGPSQMNKIHDEAFYQSQKTGQDCFRAVVISNFLVKSRPSLLRYLEKKEGRNLILISRGSCDSNASTPDIVINPRCCLILGHIQALTQRPLPGQTSNGKFSWLHERVSKLAQMYEQIFILLQYTIDGSFTAGLETTALMTAFSGYCSRLSASKDYLVHSIRILWISCNTTINVLEKVNFYVWKVIETYGYHLDAELSQNSAYLKTSLVLITDESLWEMFLVEVGLNPLAAQVILSMLKKQKYQINKGRDSSRWGLSRFVHLDILERTKMFAGVLGRSTVEIINQVFVCSM